MQSCAQERQSGLLITFTGRQTNINYAMKLAREWCQEKEGIEDPVCEVANYLSPDVKVVGGDRKVSHSGIRSHSKTSFGRSWISEYRCYPRNFILQALDFLKKNAREFGIKRTKTLPVSGAFHTRLMKPAKNVVKKALSQVELKPTAIPVSTSSSYFKVIESYSDFIENPGPIRIRIGPNDIVCSVSSGLPVFRCR